ncbi:MAG TPA: GNAT family N-acetyltransferase [Streptosporangiaceae bacterium]|nr:GNAT family N-acetyltransferase [Streptosporangiaceae bacterium]
MADGPHIRSAVPEDYDSIAGVVEEWWGRPVLGALPRLFLDLFWRTSFVIDGEDGPAAFLIGLLSPSDPERAYIHFVGVDPEARGRKLGRLLYEEFFRLARAHGRTSVRAVTAAVNEPSAAFHRAMGFNVTGPVPDYDGPGRDMLIFERLL